MAEPQDFERFAVTKIAEMVEEKGWTHSHFARLIWAFDSNAVNRWRRIRNHGQVMTVSDLYAIAQAFQCSLPSLLFEIHEAYRLSWSTDS